MSNLPEQLSQKLDLIRPLRLGAEKQGQSKKASAEKYAIASFAYRLLPYLALWGCLAAGPSWGQGVDPSQIPDRSDGPGRLQLVDPVQIPNPEPSNRPELPTRPLLPPPEELLQSPSENPSGAIPEEGTGSVPGSIDVERFEILGSNVFKQERFDNLLGDYADRSVSFAELLQARSAITDFYKDEGYITSGAFIPPQRLSDGVVQIQVVEGQLEEINVEGTSHLNSNYVRSRLGVATSGALNVNKLLTGLQMLQLDPLIETLSAELSAGSRPGTSVLEVKVKEAPAFRTALSIDNGRSPSVGTFRQQATVGHDNLFGFGDSLRGTYTRTDGSEQWEVGYAVPINARNGSLGFKYSTTDSEIIEPPFDRVDIQADSRNYELTLRQPFIQTPTREFSMGLTGVRRESQTSLLGVNFPLSPGANDDGETNLSILRFFQEWTQRDATQVFAARSQFNLGVGWFDATVNGNEPDSRFLSWRGQAQWLRVIAPETVLLLRSDVQLSATDLVPLEQFGLGGQESVRGYRQDTVLADNGVLASAELRIPLYKTESRSFVLQATPFLDVGTAWNSGGNSSPDDNTLAAIGLGLRFQLGNSLTARIDYGYPIINVDSRDRTWQENGIYFSLNANPF